MNDEANSRFPPTKLSIRMSKTRTADGVVCRRRRVRRLAPSHSTGQRRNRTIENIGFVGWSTFFMFVTTRVRTAAYDQLSVIRFRAITVRCTNSSLYQRNTGTVHQFKPLSAQYRYGVRIQAITSAIPVRCTNSSHYRLLLHFLQFVKNPTIKEVFCCCNSFHRMSVLTDGSDIGFDRRI
jgi:hypothetical protein